MKILIVEDDPSISEFIREGLEHDGYNVDTVFDGLKASYMAKTNHYDLIIMDYSLPQKNGYEVCKEIRASGLHMPIIFLSVLEDINKKIEVLEKGADDYLTKPFNLDELFARLRSLQRRFASRAAPLLVHSDITLDPASHTVVYKNEPVNLSRREFALLHVLLENAGRVLSREHLTQSLYGWGEEVDSNALEVHVHNLRKRFGQNFIRTVRGIGYTIEKSKDKQ